jgi:ATP-binding cassette subfamily F protein uup
LPPILNAQSISKSYGATPLFSNIAFTIAEGDRIGLIGPNGSGKSTLLQILSGAIEPDDGEVALRKRTRLSHVQQESRFAAGQTVRTVIKAALGRSAVPTNEWPARLAERLGRAGFENLEVATESLSGGWRKRLAIAEALVQQPDILLAGRTHEPSRPRCHRVAGGAPPNRSLCLRCGQPRPLLSRECRDCNG